MLDCLEAVERLVPRVVRAAKSSFLELSVVRDREVMESSQSLVFNVIYSWTQVKKLHSACTISILLFGQCRESREVETPIDIDLNVDPTKPMWLNVTLSVISA